MADEINIVVRAEDRFSGVLGDFGNIMTGIKSIVDLTADVFRTFVEPIIDFGQEAILAAARVNELKVVNQVLADNAGISSAAVAGAADAVRAMGIEAAVSQQVIAEFIKANLDIAKAADIARIAQDAAVISGLNSTEVTSRIIDGIVTLNPLILRNAGIIVDLQMAYKEWADENGRTVESLTTAEKQMIAMNEVIEAGAGIAGAYAAAMEEPGKVLRSFPRYFDDIMVAIGQPFQDVFAEAIFFVADFVKELGKALSEGGALHPVLVDIANGLSSILDMVIGLSGDMSPAEMVAAMSDSILALRDAIKSTFSDGLTADEIEQWIDSIDTALATGIDAHDWVATGDAFGDMIERLWSAEGIDFGDSNLLNSIGRAIGDFFRGAVGEVWFQYSIRDFANAILFMISEELKSRLNNLQSAWRQIGIDIVNGLASGISFSNMIYNIQTFVSNLITYFKSLLGISSPSSIFAEIGRNIVQGLVLGISSMITGLLGYITSIVNLLMSAFEPIINLFGLGTDSIGTGMTGGGPLGGTTGTTTGSGGQVTNNYYFYGTTYLSGVGPEGTYDCEVSPVIMATGGNLNTTPLQV